MNKGRQHSVT